MKRTPLFDVHKALGGKMSPFAGYEMPIGYIEGALKEHLWVRSKAGLFDVSHMGQLYIQGKGAAALLEKLTPSSFVSKKDGRCQYTVLTNEEGGIVDDLIVSRLDENTFYAVVNAGRKVKDLDWIKYHLPPEGVTLTPLDSRALIALQGPLAEEALLECLEIDASELPYMALIEVDDMIVSRVGYTGEDGFEISVPEERVEEIWQRLMVHSDVRPAGLAARDSLRLEMGYPLYGHDIDDVTSPVEAGLEWVISPANRSFVGASRILREIEDGPARRRAGIKLQGRGIAREGTAVFDSSVLRIGTLSSGGFSPVLKTSIGMGYFPPDSVKPGAHVLVDIRGSNVKADVVSMPFVKPRTRSRKAGAEKKQ